MAKHQITIGLDVGRYHLNMVKLACEGKTNQLLDYASIDLHPDLGRQGKLSSLQDLAQKKELAGSGVNIGISGESVIVRYIDLPNMKQEEVPQALEFEAQQYIPFKMEEVIFDYHILTAPAQANSKMKILLVAAKKEAVTDFIKLVEEAGLKVNLIEIDSFSLINCFRVSGPKVKPEDVLALVNLEFDLVNVNILQAEIPYFTRDISLLEEGVSSLWQEKASPGELFERVKPFLENLIRELRLSLDYFENEFTKSVQTIYLSGEGAKMEEMVSFFNNQLGRDVRLWNPLEYLKIGSSQLDAGLLKQAAPMLAIACGLALRRVR